MCFRKDFNSKVKIAKEDIPCYKVILINGGGIYHDIKIDGMREKWIQGTMYYETDFDLNKHEYSIRGNAFHSARTFSEAQDIRLNTFFPSSCKIVEMYIPKGAKYYENATQYCSSAIVYP